MRILLIASVALVSTACAVVPSAVPTPSLPPPVPTAAPIVPTPAPIVPTPAPPVPTAVPTPVPTQVEVKREVISAPPARGLAVWRDDTLRNDALFVSTEDLPNLANGQTYGAWLQGKDGNLFLGSLSPGSASTLVLTFASPNQINLLGDYERLTIGKADANKQPAEPVLSGSLPEKALVHVRHVLVGISATPN
jgi:hypothetical protein